MKKILLVSPYNLTKKEVGGAFTYQLCDRLSDNCKVDVIIYRYYSDKLDAPNKANIRIVKISTISKFDKILSWLQCPVYHPLFTSRFSKRMKSFVNKLIENEDYNYIIFDYSQTFALAKNINHPHKILVAHDVIYQRYEREGSVFLKWIKWSEKKLVESSEIVYAFSDKDCQLIKQLFGVECYYTPVFIKNEIIEAKPTACKDYHVFFADWRRCDNEESLEWFIDRVAESVKNEKFIIIGGGLSEKIKMKIAVYDNMEYLGYVDNPYPIIANAKSEICPLHTGAGIKVKCLEALACGTPVIGTKVSFEGIESIFNSSLLLAETPGEYVKYIQQVNYSIEEKIELKKSFLANYSQKSIINFIIQN